MPAGTGHGHRAVPHRLPARNGEGLKLRWFTGDWLLVQETAKSSPMTLPSSSTRTPARCCVSVRVCSVGRKCSTSGYSPMARWSSSPGGIGLGRCSVTPPTSGAFLRTANKPKKLGPWREYGEVYPNQPIFSTAQGHRAKNRSQKRQPDHSGVGIYAAVYPVAAGGKAGACPHCTAKWNTEKPHYRPRESLYPGTCFVGRAWTPGLVG